MEWRINCKHVGRGKTALRYASAYVAKSAFTERRLAGYDAEGRILAETIGEEVEVEALSRSVVSEFENYVKLNKKVSPEVLSAVANIEDYSKLADTMASHLAVKIQDKQEILSTASVTEDSPTGMIRPAGSRSVTALPGLPVSTSS